MLLAYMGSVLPASRPAVVEPVIDEDGTAMTQKRLWRLLLRNIFAGIAGASGTVLVGLFTLLVPFSDPGAVWWMLINIAWVVCGTSIILACLIDLSGETGETSDW